MDIGVGVGGAVGGDQELRPVVKGSLCGKQLDLHGPLAQAGDGLHESHGSFCRRFLAFERHGHGAGAAAGGRRAALHALKQLFRLGAFDGHLVVGRGLALLKGDGAGGAVWQTVAKAIAEVLTGEFGFAVDDVDGTLVTGLGAEPAAVAFVLVYVNDFSEHITTPPCFFC